MKAAQLHWSQIKHFSPSEWPLGVLQHMDARIVLALASVRSSLPNDHRMTPSPIKAAHIRAEGSPTSRHSIANNRLADATDIFMHSWAHAYAAWTKAIAHPDLGGVGFYLDKTLAGSNKPMLHFDCRPEKTLWVCHKGPTGDVYTYLHHDPHAFFLLMASKRG